MKTLIAIIFLSQIAQASILNSKLEPRHQSLIEQAVFNSCGQQNLIEQSVMEKVIRIDNGIHDRSYLINLTTQNSGDQYQIQVKSLYSDLFDHSSGNWGAYSVQSVHCRHR